MKALTIKSFAKLNLYLDILSREPSGYHTLDMIMQSISIADELTFSHIPEMKVMINSNVKELQEDNIIQIAYQKIVERFPSQVTSGFQVDLVKNIPMGAGLAGGSGNGAAMVRACIEVFDLDLKGDDLLDLLLSIGSDVPFCFEGGAQRVQGTGDILNPVMSPFKYYLIINPGIHISTQKAYRSWDDQYWVTGKIHKVKGERDKVKEALDDYTKGNIPSFTLYNAFERSLFPSYLTLAKIKEHLIDVGATQSLMTGSGSTIFGTFIDEDVCRHACEKLKNLYPFVEIAQDVDFGLLIEAT